MEWGTGFWERWKGALCTSWEEWALRDVGINKYIKRVFLRKSVQTLPVCEAHCIWMGCIWKQQGCMAGNEIWEAKKLILGCEFY
jgi:hypothetical protein